MNRAPSLSDSCPGCGIRYARFMPGQWGSGTKGNPSSAKRHAWEGIAALHGWEEAGNA